MAFTKEVVDFEWDQFKGDDNVMSFSLDTSWVLIYGL